MDLGERPPTRRRRGKELETALLEAAWEQLREGGYASFTMEAVAERAGTSRPVLYRRWPGREELVLAVIEYQSDQYDIPTPDTGSLREDVIALLTGWNEHRIGLVTVLGVALVGFLTETGRSVADVRKILMSRRGSRMDLLVSRAAQRGEIDPERLTPRLIALPFDLFRNEIMLTFEPVSEKAILEIVDDIFLPLVLRK